MIIPEASGGSSRTDEYDGAGLVGLGERVDEDSFSEQKVDHCACLFNAGWFKSGIQMNNAR